MGRSQQADARNYAKGGEHLIGRVAFRSSTIFAQMHLTSVVQPQSAYLLHLQNTESLLYYIGFESVVELQWTCIRALPHSHYGVDPSTFDPVSPD